MFNEMLNSKQPQVLYLQHIVLLQTKYYTNFCKHF